MKYVAKPFCEFVKKRKIFVLMSTLFLFNFAFAQDVVVREDGGFTRKYSKTEEMIIEAYGNLEKRYENVTDADLASLMPREDLCEGRMLNPPTVSKMLEIMKTATEEKNWKWDLEPVLVKNEIDRKWDTLSHTLTCGDGSKKPSQCVGSQDDPRIHVLAGAYMYEHNRSVDTWKKGLQHEALHYFGFCEKAARYMAEKLSTNALAFSNTSRRACEELNRRLPDNEPQFLTCVRTDEGSKDPAAYDAVLKMLSNWMANKKVYPGMTIYIPFEGSSKPRGRWNNSFSILEINIGQPKQAENTAVMRYADGTEINLHMGKDRFFSQLIQPKSPTKLRLINWGVDFARGFSVYISLENESLKFFGHSNSVTEKDLKAPIYTQLFGEVWANPASNWEGMNHDDTIGIVGHENSVELYGF